MTQEGRAASLLPVRSENSTALVDCQGREGERPLDVSGSGGGGAGAGGVSSGSPPGLC